MAGSAIRFPSLAGLPFDGCVRELQANGIRCVAADPRGKVSYAKWDWTAPTALILGAEGGGLKHAAALETISIPMTPPVESLNVAVTAGILLYEASCHRRKDL